MARFYITFILIFVLPYILHPQSQDIKFERISVEQGLSNDVVHCIFQDSKGFMWFGTEDGLNKFDGYKFTIYKYDPAILSSLSNNNVKDIYEDQSTNLWIATAGGGLNKFDRETEKFTHYKFDQSNPSSISSNDTKKITGFNYGERKVLWIGTSNGLNKFDVETEQFTYYPPTNKDFVEAMVVDSLGKVWIGYTDGGLHRFDPETEKYVHYLHDPNNPNTPSSNLSWSLLVDRSGILWIGTDGGGLDKFDNHHEQFAHYRHNPNNPNSLSNNKITSIYEDKAGILWIGTWEGGLNKFDRKTQKFTQFKHDPHKSYSLSINSIWSIYQDKSDVLWIGTWFGGLNRFNPGRLQFEHPLYSSYYKEELNLPIWGINESKSGVLWVGTWGKGLVKIDWNQNKVSHFRYDPLNPNSLGSNLVNQIIISHYRGRDVLWCGTFNGLNRLDLNTQQIKRYFIKRDATDNIIRSVYEDKTETLWVATQTAGLYKFDREKGQFTLVGRRMQVMQVYEDKSGIFWVATFLGLKKLDRETEQFTTFWHDPENPNSICNNQILSIYETSFKGKYMLWIGTRGGLNKFDPELEKFTSYTTKDGLPNDVINGILEDNLGNLWISTNKGLSKFNPETETFRNYNVIDGLKNNQFIEGTYFQSRDGAMFFGGTKGFDAFFPDNVKDNPRIPQVVITDFQIFNIPVKIKGEDSAESDNDYFLSKNVNSIEEIELSYKENVFSFEFAALDYRSPRGNKYAYKMEGVDRDWVHTDASRRFATYTNLDPGAYVFRVKGSNNDGHWNEEGTTIRITITPPWWQTNLAYSFYVLLIGSIILGVWRFQTNRLKMKHELELEHVHTEKLEEVDQLKSRFFANISHEFRTPLTLILGPVEQMISGELKGNLVEQYKIIRRNGKRLLQLINQLLDLSKLESGRLKLQTRATEIISLTNELVQAFESLAVRKKITLKFKTEIQLQKVYIDIEKFETIINNLVSNAFKFTPEGGKVIVDCRLWNADLVMMKKSKIQNPKSKFMEITISNTGPGIPANRIDKIFDRFYQIDDSYTKDEEGTGIGLALTKELVELHHGEIKVTSVAIGDNGKGTQPPESLFKGELFSTTFTVLLPLGKEHLTEDELVDTLEDSPLKKGARGLSKPVISQKIDVEAHGNAPTIESASIILIVEDNADLRQYIRSNMDNQYRIIEAENGEEGLERATNEIPDLIISDVMMPKMDGFEFCAKIKTDERTSHIPVILITARAAQEDKIEGLETGADDYITKPFDNKELNVRVKNLIEQRQLLKKRFSSVVGLKPEEIAPTLRDKKFTDRIMEIIQQNMSDSKFNLEFLSKEIGMSRMSLHRKIIGLFGQSPGDFVRTIRLKHGAELLKNKTETISEIAYEVGFSNPANFSASFRQQFGISPAKYSKTINNT